LLQVCIDIGKIKEYGLANNQDGLSIIRAKRNLYTHWFVTDFVRTMARLGWIENNVSVRMVYRECILDIFLGKERT
jgi:hypothetical protein